MESCIEVDVIEQLRQLGDSSRPGLLPELIEMFRTSACKLRREIEDAARSGDLGAVQGAAHPLKSSSAQLGAMRVSAQARRIEEAAGEGRLEDAQDLSDHLGALLDEALDVLARLARGESGA